MAGTSKLPWVGGGAFLGTAMSLTVGLLGWELVLRLFVSGDLGSDVGALARGLAWDGALLLPLFLGVSACVSRSSRRTGVLPDVQRTAARASLLFLLLLIPSVAARRGLQQWSAEPGTSREAPQGRAVPATEASEERDGRFLCSAVSTSPGDGSAGSNVAPWETVWAAGQDALLLQVPVFPLLLFVLGRRRRHPGALHAPASGRRRTPFPALLTTLAVAWSWGSDGKHLATEEAWMTRLPERGCPPGAPVRRYDVAAISVDIPLNAYGDHVPRGLMYALEEERPALREKPLQPLVLRANLGECLIIRFTNRLATEAVSLRITGLSASVAGAGRESSDLPGTAARPGQQLTYVLPLPVAREAEGAYPIQEGSTGGGTGERGLFGALVLEPAGAVYRSTTTGEPLKHGTGWEAIIDVPDAMGRDFREAVLMFHSMGPPESADVRFADGSLMPILDEMSGPFRPGGFGLNYRSDPVLDREEFQPKADARRRSREPSTPVIRSYLNEPVRLRVLHAGSAEFHLADSHVRRESGRGPKEETHSPLERPLLLSPGRSVTLATSDAPGGAPSTAGNFNVHCHMPGHATGGMRSQWRVFETRQADLAPLPDEPRTQAR
ncbi:cupredoxin [Pyxidicoccus sp. 3LG]